MKIDNRISSITVFAEINGLAFSKLLIDPYEFSCLLSKPFNFSAFRVDTLGGQHYFGTSFEKLQEYSMLLWANQEGF